MKDSLTIGVLQFNPHWGDIQANFEKTEDLIASARERKCEVVVLPEMWPTGMYGDLDFQKLKEPIPGRYTNFLSQQARRNGIHIVAGMPEQGEGTRVHNTAVLIDPRGKLLAKHRKLHLYSSLGEEKVWTPGSSFTVVDTDFGRAGLLVCYDGDFVESWRANALMGAEIVFDLSFYETPCESWWNKFYPAAALQNVLWAVLCNTVGDTVLDGKPLHAFGQSRIIAPDGEIEAEAPYVKVGQRAESFLLVKAVKFRRRLFEAQEKYGNFLRDRRPDAYQILTAPRSNRSNLHE